MGPAPGDTGQPAMPAPARVVSQSARLLTRLGFSQAAAYDTIIDVCWRVHARLNAEGAADSPWISDVGRVAVRRRRALVKSHTDRKEGSHANRAGPGNTG